MAADEHIHVCLDYSDEVNAKAYLNHEFSCCKNPIERINPGLHIFDPVLTNWSYGRQEYRIRGRWYSEDVAFRIFDVFEKKNKEYDFTDNRVIYMYIDMDVIYRTPNVWIGEVSWLKAALFGGEERYIPDPVGRISEIFDGLITITDDIIRLAREAMRLDNKTQYKIADPKKVTEFLEQYKGKKAFTIAW
jgi:hypothetical protein